MPPDLKLMSCSFEKGSPGSLYLTQGWEYPEAWGVKNAASTSEIRLPEIIVDVDGVVAFNFWCECKSKTVVYINGNFVAIWPPGNSFSIHTVECLSTLQLAPRAPVFVQFQTETPRSLGIASLWVWGGRFSNSKFPPPAAQDILNDSALQAPLFITGIPRSGTSIVYKIVSDALGANNPSLIESYFFSWAFTKFEQQFAGDCANAFLGDDLSGIFNTVRLENFVNPDFNDILTLSRYYYRLAAVRYGPPRVIDKTPEHIFFGKTILRAFPDAKIIFCNRPAMDVYASYKKRSRAPASVDSNANEREWLSINCDAFAIEYQQYLEAARSIMNRKESVLVVDYDRLIAREYSLLGKVSDFIGCELSMLYSALDKPMEANREVSSALRGGTLVENRINAQEYLDEKEIATLRDIPGVVLKEEE